MREVGKFTERTGRLDIEKLFVGTGCNFHIFEGGGGSADPSQYFSLWQKRVIENLKEVLESSLKALNEIQRLFW